MRDITGKRWIPCPEEIKAKEPVVDIKQPTVEMVEAMKRNSGKGTLANTFDHDNGEF